MNYLFQLIYNKLFPESEEKQKKICANLLKYLSF